MQVEDPVFSGGGEERRLRRIYGAQGSGRKVRTNDIFFLSFFALSLEPYALSRGIEERPLARLWREGNAANDTLMADQGKKRVDITAYFHIRSRSPCGGARELLQIHEE